MKHKKILYFGGQKSGKSRLAETKTLELSNVKKPYYLATYDNSYNDEEMQQRINRHQQQREEKFITIEEAFGLEKVMHENETYLVDCISMWILNNLSKSEEELLAELERLSHMNATMVFVLNNVNDGVIPLEKVSRKFVDLTGVVGQKLASFCDEVYEVKVGIALQLK